MVQIDKVLEFDKIKEKWIELALTEWAKEKIKDTVPCMSENELMAKQRETSEARKLLEKNGNPPLVSLDGNFRSCGKPKGETKDPGSCTSDRTAYGIVVFI